MPSIKDLFGLKPIRSRYKSDLEFKIQSAHWEEHIAPVIIRLENIAQTRPIKSSFENDEEFEEALGFWTRPDCLREG